jgi:hypothetical protein
MKKGIVAVMKGNRIVVHNLQFTTTSFTEIRADGTVALRQYSGEHEKRPETNAQVLSINVYTQDLSLKSRTIFRKGEEVNEYIYRYNQPERRSTLESKSNRSRKSRIPSLRICIGGEDDGEVMEYTRKGLVKGGKGTRNGDPYEFAYDYRRKARFMDELLRGTYVFNPNSQSSQAASVSWCVPPVRKPEELDRWIPFSKVTQAQFTRDGQVYETKWSYDHKCHPILSSTLNAEEAPTPDWILGDHYKVLSKPSVTSFADDDPLLPFDTIKPGFFRKLFGMNKRHLPVPTSRARTYLWTAWKNSMQLDGVTARMLDETALRSERILKPYWSARDRGDLHAAIKFLRNNGDTIMASVDVDHEVSAWTSLAYKMSDFFSLGQGGDTSINTRTTGSQMSDAADRLHVLATDYSTWPCEGGGVSCCRRDLVNNLHNIKWHIIAETANDFAIPRFQIEHNVQSVKILPLWGLDFLTPTHGIIENQLDTVMETKLIDTNDRDIKDNFLPILDCLVRGVRALHYNATNVAEFSKMLVRLNTYFEHRNWGAVWNSKPAKYRWRELWLSKSMGDARPISNWFDLEKPTLSHLDDALELYSRCNFHSTRSLTLQIYLSCQSPFPTKSRAFFKQHTILSARYTESRARRSAAVCFKSGITVSSGANATHSFQQLNAGTPPLFATRSSV